MDSPCAKKSDMVRRYVSEGDFKKALRIASDFKLGITKSQSSTMKRAYECMVHPDFYRSIGVDIAEAVNDGISIVKSIYGEPVKA